MGTLYFDSGGASTNSGSRDEASPHLTVTVDGTYAGGATIPLSGSPDLSTLNTSGDTQDTVHFADATNVIGSLAKRIFWITAVDDVAKEITVETAPTGLSAGSSQGVIGGQLDATGAELGSRILRYNTDTAICNTDLSKASFALNFVANGDVTSAGKISLIGKAGARRVLTNTSGSVNVVTFSQGSRPRPYVENIEVQNQGAGGRAFNSDGANTWTIFNCRATDAAADGAGGGSGYIAIGCEFSGAGGHGMGNCSAALHSYFHDNAADGIGGLGSLVWFIDCIIERNGDQGIRNALGASSLGPFIYRCTIYLNGASGVHQETAAAYPGMLIMSSILKDNGNASGEANIEITTTDADQYYLISRNNCISVAGGVGGDNVINWTLDASDITSDPLFNDPDNASASSRDFGLQDSSPAKGAGYGTFLGSGSVGHPDIGAVQREEPAAGSGSGGPRKHGTIRVV